VNFCCKELVSKKGAGSVHPLFGCVLVVGIFIVSDS
jgi:hypothetical protein